MISLRRESVDIYGLINSLACSRRSDSGARRIGGRRAKKRIFRLLKKRDRRERERGEGTPS